MDNTSNPFTEICTPCRISPHQETVASADGRMSMRDSEDPTQSPSFFGSKSDLVLSQTVSMTSLLSAKKTSLRGAGGKKFPRKSALQRRWEEKNSKMFSCDSRDGSVPKAKTASARNRSPRNSAPNIGNSLYLRGLEMKEGLKRKAQEFILNESLAERDFFKPKVDENSHLMLPRFHTSVEDSLLSWGSQKDERLTKLKTSLSQEELEICPFSPKLDPRSIKLASQRRSENPRFVDLFQLAVEQKDKQQQYLAETHSQECPFRPRIFAEKKTAETKDQFIQRLYTSKVRAGAETEKEESGGIEQNDVIEEEPIQKVIQRSDRPTNVSVYEFLYSLREKPATSDSEAKAAPPPIEENQASHKVFSSFQQACIAAIFGVLDEDRNGLISGSLRSPPALNEKQFAVLKPVLREIEKSGEAWDQERFEGRVNELVAGLNVEDRGYLLTRVKAVPEANGVKNPAEKKAAAVGRPTLLTERVSAVTLT